MKFHYSKENLTGGEKELQRFFEILPGLASWTILITTITLSFVKPVWAAVLIIAFYLFWILKLLYVTIFLVLSYARLKMESPTDWLKRLKEIDQLEETLKNTQYFSNPKNFRARLSNNVYLQELTTLKESNWQPPKSDDIYHVIILPIIKESLEIVEPGVKSLSEQTFPTNRMIVIFALEDRAHANIKQDIFSLEEKYKDRFLKIMTIVHPSNLPHEARVKGANVTYAAKETEKYLSEKNIPLENVLVSCFDADTVVGRNYFSALTYYFMVTPDRIQSSYQPIPVYHNNIWDVPGFARVIETGSSFFQLVEATNPEKLVTFSSHSMSFKALKEVSYWPIDMISDDSAIYWKCFIHYDGEYSAVPMFVTLSMDVAGTQHFWETARIIYKQKRRWAWGVENFPILMRACLKSDKISFYSKLQHIFKMFEGHVSWATWGFLLNFIGWMPAILVPKGYETSVIYYNSPRIAFTIFNLALFSLVISIILSIRLLPKSKHRFSFFVKCFHAIEWLTMPFILVFFSALPALDAQTRLMFGRYMEFWVTDKKRKKEVTRP